MPSLRKPIYLRNTLPLLDACKFRPKFRQHKGLLDTAYDSREMSGLGASKQRSHQSSSPQAAAFLHPLFSTSDEVCYADVRQAPYCAQACFASPSGRL